MMRQDLVKSDFNKDLAKIGEQAKNFAEEFHEKCKIFRIKLQEGRVYAYHNELAKLYYDFAVTFYKYYYTNPLSDNKTFDNLLSVKKYLQMVRKCFELAKDQDDSDSRSENALIIKTAGEFILPIKKHYDELKGQKRHLVNSLRLTIFKILKNNSLVEKEAALKSESWSVSGVISSMKGIISGKKQQKGQRIKKLYELWQLLMQIFEKSPKESERFKLKNAAALTEIKNFLIMLIEVSLKISSYKKVCLYIEYLKIIANDDPNIKEFELRVHLIKSLNRLAKLELSLLYPATDDVDEFWIVNPESEAEYQSNFKKWQDAKDTMSSILYIKNFQSKRVWEAWLLIPAISKSIFKTSVVPDSILYKFLEHKDSRLLGKSFTSELLEFSAEKGSLVQVVGNPLWHEKDKMRLKSKEDKVLQSFSELSQIYAAINYNPLRDYYKNSMHNVIIARNKFKKELLSKLELTYQEQESPLQAEGDEKIKAKHEAPVFLFPMLSWCGARKLNDPITEQEFITQVLPKLDQVPGLQRTINVVYDVWWHSVDTNAKKVSFLADWQRFIPVFKKKRPYQRKQLLLYIESAKKWYLYGELSDGRISEGYLDEKEELLGLRDILEGVVPLDLKKNENQKNEKEFLILKFLKALDSNTEEVSLSEETEIIKAMSKEDYQDYLTSKNPIVVYDLSKYEENKLLRDRIKHANKNFSCIVRLSDLYYVTLFFAFDEKLPDKEANTTRYIYVMDSHHDKLKYEKVDWFSGIVNEYQLTLNIIEVPKQKLFSNDSFIHSYFSAFLLTWAYEHGHFSFVKENFYRLNLTSSENLEKIKMWWIGESYNKSDKQQSDEVPAEIKPHLENLNNYFGSLVKSSLSQVNLSDIKKYAEELSKTLRKVSKYEDLEKIIQEKLKENNSEKAKVFSQEIYTSIQALREYSKKCALYKQKPFSMRRVTGQLNIVIETQLVNTIALRTAAAKLLTEFDELIHNIIVDKLLENKGNVDKYEFQWISGLNALLHKTCEKVVVGASEEYGDFVHYKNFLQLFISYIYKTGDFKNKNEIVKLIQQLENTLNKESLIHETKLSLMNIKAMLNRFVDVGEGLASFHHYYVLIIRHCYDTLELAEAHQISKSNIFDRIVHKPDSFEDIERCIETLKTKAYTLSRENTVRGVLPALEKKSAELALSKAIAAFKSCIAAKDAYAVHYLSAYLRNAIFSKLDLYMKSMAQFRYQSLSAIEQFSKVLHHVLTASTKLIIENALKKGVKHEKYAVSAFDCLNKSLQKHGKIDYQIRIEAINTLVTYFKDLKILPESLLKKLSEQLQNTSHSHFVYLEAKLNELHSMLQRFAFVENQLEVFFDCFWKALHRRYDHLAHEIVFSESGMIKKEILSCVRPGKDFSDIKNISQTLNDDELVQIIKQFDEFFKRHRDEKGGAEISESLRYFFTEVTLAYSNSLLSFRHNAMISLTNFMRAAQLDLSSYAAIKDDGLRKILENQLTSLKRFIPYQDSYYGHCHAMYKEFIQKIVKEIQHLFPESRNILSQLERVFNEAKHTLRPLFPEIFNNLVNLLDNYVNYIQIIVEEQSGRTLYQIQITAAALSDVIKLLKHKHQNCFSPNNEIRILSAVVLYLDVNLDETVYSGVSFSLTGPRVELPSGKPKFIVDISGRDAEDIWKDKPAPSASGTDQNHNGRPGEAGNSGARGTSAGHLYIEASKLPELEVTANGGNGGTGQAGGNGSDGLPGTDGESADSGKFEQQCKDRWGDSVAGESHRAYLLGTRGQPGGDGGDSGAPGTGGNEGSKGKVVLRDQSNPEAISAFTAKEGNPGADGALGKPGQAGKNGKDGRDCQVVSNSRGGWVSYLSTGLFSIIGFLVTKYIIYPRQYHMNTGYIHFPNKLQVAKYGYEYHHDEGVKESHFSYWPMYSEQSVEAARERDKENRRGRERRAQHKNRQEKQGIYPINRQNVFQQTAQFYAKFCNPRNKNSYQHWLAASLNSFLAKMAANENLPYEDFAARSVDEEIQQIMVFKDKFADMVALENQRLQAEKIDTDNLSIGVQFRAEAVLAEYDAFQVESQAAMQMLQAEIQSVNVATLRSGLQRHLLSEEITRSFNEKRVNAELAASQNRLNVLVEMTRQDHSKFSHDYIRMDRNYRLQDKAWLKFELTLRPFSTTAVSQFNEQPNERNLISIGDVLISDILSRKFDSTELSALSKFIECFLFNFRICDFDQERNAIWPLQLLYNWINEERPLKSLNSWLNDLYTLKQTTLAPNLDKNITFFIQDLLKEKNRYYWLKWIYKTIACIDFTIEKDHQEGVKNREYYLDLIQNLKSADIDELEVVISELSDNSDILRDFSGIFEPSEKFYKATAIFADKTNKETLVSIFREFVKTMELEKKSCFWNTVADGKKLRSLALFFETYIHNLSLMQLSKNEFISLTFDINQLIGQLDQYPQSGLHYLIYDLSKAFTQLKEIQLGSSFTKDKKLAERAARIGSQNIEDRIAAFHTSLNKDLAVELLSSLAALSSFKNFKSKINKASIEFLKWIIENINEFDEESIAKILVESKALTTINLTGINIQEFVAASQYLYLMADYKKTLVQSRKEIESLENEGKIHLDEYGEFNSIIKRIQSYLNDFIKIQDASTIKILLINLFEYMSKLNKFKIQEALVCTEISKVNDTILILTDILDNLSNKELSDKIVAEIEACKKEISQGLDDKQRELILKDIKQEDRDAALKSLASNGESLKLLAKIDMAILEKFKESMTLSVNKLNFLKNIIHRETFLLEFEHVFTNITEWNSVDASYLINQLKQYGIYTKDISLMNFESYSEKLVSEIKLLQQLFGTLNLISKNIKENLSGYEYNLLLISLKQFYKNCSEAEIDRSYSQIIKPLMEVFKYQEIYKIKDFKKTIEDLSLILIGKTDAQTVEKFRKNAFTSLIQSHELFKKYFELDFKFGTSDVLKIILEFLNNEMNSKLPIIREIYINFYNLSKKKCQSQEFGEEDFHVLISLFNIISLVNTNSLSLNAENPELKIQLLLLQKLLERAETKQFGNTAFIDFLKSLFIIMSKHPLENQEEGFSISIEAMETLDAYLKTISLVRGEELQLLKSFEKSIKLTFIKNHITELFIKKPNASWLGIFDQVSADILEKQETISETLYAVILKKEVEETKEAFLLENVIAKFVQGLQKSRIDKLMDLITSGKKEESELRKKILDALKNIPGIIGFEIENPEKYNATDAELFSCLLEVLIRKLTIDSGLNQSMDDFANILLILACFGNLRVPMGVISMRGQKEWLKILLVEHIVEKYNLLFSDSSSHHIYQMLAKMNSQLLMLFNNILVSEHRDQIIEANELGASKTAASPYQKISKEQIDCIVNFMSTIQVDKDILDRLAGTSLLVWDTVLYEINFVQSYNKALINHYGRFDFAESEKILLILNQIRVKEGTNNSETFMNFFSSSIQSILSQKALNFTPFLIVVTAIYNQEITFTDACSIIKENCSNWKKKTVEYRKSRYEEGRAAKDRTATELVAEIVREHGKQFNAISIPVLEEVGKKAMECRAIAEGYRTKGNNKFVLEGDEKSFIARRIQEVFDCKKYQEDPEKYLRGHLTEVVPVILYAWWVSNEPQFPKHTQVLAFLLSIYCENEGLFEQVSTGEGKTLIVGLVAAFKALCGYAVDIVSSNRDLAIEGEHKCRTFLELLKCSSGHICSEDQEVNRKAYENTIVYGDVGYFQRDILEQECNGRRAFGDRYKDKKKCLILDEVDSLGLDKARHVLYLSHEIESLKYIESVFINIWTAVLKADLKEAEDISKHVKDVSDFMIGRVKSKDIKVPKYMHNYIFYKMSRWVDSAFQARIMQEDDQFVFDIPKTEGEEKAKKRSIIILDKATGIEQYSTRWSDGLAQFMELKFRRKISIESLKAVYISNKAFFQRYTTNLIGLTGTLGSPTSQRFLAGVYGVKFVTLPTSKVKRLRPLPGIVAEDFTNWLDRITASAIEISEVRPVEIICENIERASSVEKALQSKGVSPQSIVRYVRDGDDVEKRFSHRPATRGDIIITTNKGGRGTDITVDDEVDIVGGLHVILGYLPENDRIEDQAVGRTARNGRQGTFQLILQVETKAYDELCKTQGLPFKDLAELIIIKEKALRDEREKLRLKELQQKYILQLEVEEELFAKFNQFKNNIIGNILQKKLSGIDQKLKDKVIASIYGVLKDHWAFWLDRKKEKISKVEHADDKEALIAKFQKNLNKKFKLFEKLSLHVLLNELIRKPEEAVQLGIAHLYVDRSQDKSKEHSKDQITCAKQCFERAVELKENSGFAYIGLAFCIIKLNENGDARTKKEARRVLKEAIKVLEAQKVVLMANLKIADVLASIASPEVLKKLSSSENYYQDQVQGKLEVIGLHLHYLKQAAGEYLEPFDFTSGNGDEAARNKSRAIYDTLVDAGFIHGDVLRKKYKGAGLSQAQQMIREMIDPVIAEPLIELLSKKSNDVFKPESFEDIVNCNEDLWQSLNLPAGKIETVYVLDRKRLEKELESRFEKDWQEIEMLINPNAVDIAVFNKSAPLLELKSHLLDKKLMVQTRRVKLEDMKAQFLSAKFNFDGKYARYRDITFNNGGRETKGIQSFIKEVIALKSQELQKKPDHEGALYIYQDELPFGSKQEEAAKILIFLKENNILKSGGLCKQYKSGGIKIDLKHNIDLKSDINEALDHALKNSQFKSDKEFIKNKLLAAQGDIRSYKDGINASLKLFTELEDQHNFPDELPFFIGLGLDKFLIVEEDKSWWDWGAFAVFLIGVAQIILGAILCVFGAANIGNALISEGINDMVYATMAMISGKFSWKDWIAQKIISFALSILTAGIATLANIGKTAAKVGSLSTMALVGKILVRCLVDVAVSVLSNILTEAAVSEIQKNIIDKIVGEVLDGLSSKVSSSLEKDLEELCKREADLGKFVTLIYDLAQNIQAAIQKGGSIVEQFSSMQSQVGTVLRSAIN